MMGLRGVSLVRHGSRLLCALVLAVAILIVAYHIRLSNMHSGYLHKAVHTTRLLHSNDSRKDERWIILDVTSGHCDGHTQAPPGWTLLRAGETTQQEGHNPLLLEALRLDRNFSRQVIEGGERPLWKNLAYLVAVSRGARYVLDTDCSVAWPDLLRQLQAHSDTHQGLLYNSSLLFNPYAHFGAWALVPKAVVGAERTTNSRQYYVRDFSKVLVKHALSDRSDDSVAVEPSGQRGGKESVQSGHNDGVGVKFHFSSPPVYVGQRSFSPAVPVSSLYRGHEALWSLLLPCLTPTLFCQVLKVFLQQRLFRELDAFSGYYSLQSSSVSTSLAAHRQGFRFIEGNTVSRLASLLDAWNCNADLAFYGCFHALVDHVHVNGYLSGPEKALMDSWINALKMQGVAEPVRVRSPWRGFRRRGEVGVLWGSLQARLEADNTTSLWNQSVRHVEQRCNVSSGESWLTHASQWTAPVLEDVVLIIVFNSPSFFWPNVPLLEAIHRPFFKHIVYCVSDVRPLMREDQQEAWRHLVIVEGLSDSWFLMYGCVTTVIQMNVPGVLGYVMIGDDTLLNTWTLFNVPRDVILLYPLGRGQMERADSVVSARPWQWWKHPKGRCALLKAMAGLEQLSRLSRQQLLDMIPHTSGGGAGDTQHRANTMTFSQILHSQRDNLTYCTSLPGSEAWPKPSPETARRFLWNYYHTHNMSGRVPHKATDFLYLPQAMARDYVAISRPFMAQGVMVEVAYNVMQVGLSGPGQWRTLHAASLWGKARHSPDKAFNRTQFYMHPFKLAHPPNDQAWHFFCHVYLSTLFSEGV